MTMTAMTIPTAIPILVPVEVPPESDELVVEAMATSVDPMLSENSHCEIEKFWRSQSTMRYVS